MPEPDDDAEPAPRRIILDRMGKPWAPPQHIEPQAYRVPGIRPWLLLVLPLVVMLIVVLLLILDGGH